MPEPRIPVHYTFGNHMHWVDMQWLWGYHVLPGCIEDMLRFCRETDAKGCVNFDGVGYEKLAAEAPEALEKLRIALQDGTVELTGCSYGQPYGQFHGGESNVRQRVYGVRAALRLFGVRPRAFWEEEFDCFPQLPQMLAGSGFEFASLFFQWTWHTPEVPHERAPAVWWEGVDGTRLLTATRNRLNLHQWPEDFDGLLDGLAANPPSGPTPLILQWLELMPSSDWMCRSEVLLPRMRELRSDPRFDIRFGTLSEYLGQVREFAAGGDRASDDVPGASSVEAIRSEVGQAAWVSKADPDEAIPTRRYRSDQLWHGMSLGKNWDAHPRKSALIERILITGEALHATLGLFGRPYANWDVYPTWEFEEAWRQLLAFQHHDNHECEGLCGHVAEGLYVQAYELSKQANRAAAHLASRSGLRPHSLVAINGLGASQKTFTKVTNRDLAALQDLPGFGYAFAEESDFQFASKKWEVQGVLARFASETLQVELNLKTGALRQLEGNGIALRPDPVGEPIPQIEWMSNGLRYTLGDVQQFQLVDDGATIEMVVGPDQRYVLRYSLVQEMDAVDVYIAVEGETAPPDPGLNCGIHLVFPRAKLGRRIFADRPYSIEEAQPSGPWKRKYPEGDWMTSSQWFETVEGSVTGLTFLDFVDEHDNGLLVVGGGTQQWLFKESEARAVLNMIDPWDEARSVGTGQKMLRLIPHGPISNAQRRTRADQSLNLFHGVSTAALKTLSPSKSTLEGPPIPRRFTALRCLADNVVPSAFYRETEDYSGRGLERYAGRGMGYPYVLRLVEYDGIESDVELIVAGPVARAAKTNLMGEVEAWLEPRELSRAEQDLRPLGASMEELRPFGIFPQRLQFKVRPYEIVTLYLDLIPGRKQPRDLDAKREVWATVHRTD